VEGSYSDWPGIELLGNPSNPVDYLLDVGVLAVVGDVFLGGLPRREDHVLHPKETDAVGSRCGGAFCGFGDRDVDLHLGAGHRLDRRLWTDLLDGVALVGAGLALPDGALVAVDGDR